MLKPHLAGFPDFPCRHLTSDGNFSMRTAYNTLHVAIANLEPSEPLFGRIWKWKRPTHYKGFLWKLVQARLMTNEERAKCRITADALCPRCGDCPETIMHVLHDCEGVKDFWANRLKPKVFSHFSAWVIIHGWVGTLRGSKLVHLRIIGAPFLRLRCISYGVTKIILSFRVKLILIGCCGKW